MLSGLCARPAYCAAQHLHIFLVFSKEGTLYCDAHGQTSCPLSACLGNALQFRGSKHCRAVVAQLRCSCRPLDLHAGHPHTFSSCPCLPHSIMTATACLCRVSPIVSATTCCARWRHSPPRAPLSICQLSACRAIASTTWHLGCKGHSMSKTLCLHITQCLLDLPELPAASQSRLAPH